ncbi:MAG: signal peptidase I [Chitinophagales bacterium]|jgi:signal peptidase I
MDINFELILVVLVGICFVIWLVDKLFLSKKRHGDTPMPIEYARSFLPVLAIVLGLRSFLIEPFQIPSASMVPTLIVGDFILVNKFAYGLRLPAVRTKVVDVDDPERGDVMVFYPPHVHIYYIKRVIGLPGDKIAMVDKVLYVNDIKADQKLLARLPVNQPEYNLLIENIAGVEHQIQTNIEIRREDNFSYIVPEGHYFMMGDNRNNSSDSRFWGPVPEENIVGKAFGIWMNWGEFLSIPSFKRVGAIE